MKSILKIALLQIAPCGSLEGNLEKGIENCIKAKKLGADIALFPEMWSNGYDIYQRPASQWTKEAIGTDSKFVSRFGALAKELDMAIGITLLEKTAGKPRNTLVLFDRRGERHLFMPRCTPAILALKGTFRQVRIFMLQTLTPSKASSRLAL